MFVPAPLVALVMVSQEFAVLTVQLQFKPASTINESDDPAAACVRLVGTKA